MKRFGVSRRVLIGVAAILALVAAGTALSVSIAAGAAPVGALAETDTTPTTDPTPDPAPAPAAKPAVKPKPAARTSTPRPTSHAPTPKPTPPAPSYTSPRSTQTSTPPQRHTVKRKPRHKTAQPTVAKLKPSTAPEPNVLAPIRAGSKRDAITSTNDDKFTRILLILCVSLALLILLVAAAVPGTPARFTQAGRVVVDHQQDLVMVGIAALVITLFVFSLTGHLL